MSTVIWYEDSAMWIDNFLEAMKSRLEAAIAIINSDTCRAYHFGEIDTTVYTYYPKNFSKKLCFGIDVANIQNSKVSDEKPGGSDSEINIQSILRIYYGNLSSKVVEMEGQRTLANLIMNFVNNEIGTITNSGVQWQEIHMGQVDFEVAWLNGNYGLEIEINAKTTLGNYIN